MTAVDSWDVRAEFEHVATAEQRAVQTPRDEGFVMRRRIWPSPRGEIRVFDLGSETATVGEIYRLWELWGLTHDVLNLTYTPQDGSGAIEVGFLTEPVVERVSAVKHRYRVQLEEVL